MPVVKNSVPSKLGADVAQILAVAHRLLPIIGLASHPVLRATRGFEYWNLEILWSLKFGSLEFPFPAPAPNQTFSRLIKANKRFYEKKYFCLTLIPRPCSTHASLHPRGLEKDKK
jgi:hypothetical protein